MNEEKLLLYDGSFEGFLTSLFTAFEYKLAYPIFRVESNAQNILFSEPLVITTDLNKAKRVYNGIRKKLSSQSMQLVLWSFLSESKDVETLIFHFLKQSFSKKKDLSNDYANTAVLKVHKLVKSVGREKHRMEAFVRFKLTKDGIYFANIEPDFNVLPLISGHFKERYADQKWIIYDIKRKYAIAYDLNKVEPITIDLSKHFNFSKTSSDFFSEEEIDFQTLWKDYFKSTNIKSRVNMKLHIQHVPKRYWKYLSEKQPDNF